jgi:hypothetical protein
MLRSAVSRREVLLGSAAALLAGAAPLGAMNELPNAGAQRPPKPGV